MKYYAISESDMKTLAEAIRSKTGKTEKMTPKQMSAEVASVEPVRYVTFMNGDIELYKKSVAYGDDCVDVLTKGLIDTPTKESTAQYHYTYYGWGSADNGAADDSILKNVTEDRVVYAIFTSTVRTYAITFYDEDGTTKLGEELFAYGTVPSFSVTKEGYVHKGWNPTLVAVTGEASYSAVWSTYVAQGTCGSSVTWIIDPYYCLTLFGTGTTYGYGNAGSVPWAKYSSQIQSVVIEEGLTSLGKYLLSGLTSVVTITVPNGVTTLGEYVFSGCTSLVTLTLPEGITVIPTGMADGCTSLTGAPIPESVMRLKFYAYRNTKFGNGSITIPANVTTIEPNCFDGVSIRYMYFIVTSVWRYASTSTTTGTVADVSSAYSAASLYYTWRGYYWKRS